MDGPKVGRLVEGNPGRDAIHVAVVPVTAEHDISPGTPVGLSREGKAYEVVEGAVGIVDPFLPDNVARGERFYLFLYPNTVTSLRHVWTHPAIPDPPAVPPAPAADRTRQAAREWLVAFASRHTHPYRDDSAITADDLIDAGREYLNYAVYYTQQGSESLRDAMGTPEAAAEFWRNWSAATGTPVPGLTAGESPFSCTC